MVGVLWLGAGPGRTVGLGSFTFLTADTVTSGPSGPPEFPDWFGEGARAAAVEMTALRRVVAVGQVTEVEAIRIEMTALELREGGGVALAVAHTEPPDARSLGPFARISVLDDVGTAYAAGSEGSGGSQFATRLSIRFAPAPPEAAGQLTIRIEEFVNPFPGPARQAGRRTVGVRHPPRARPGIVLIQPRGCEPPTRTGDPPDEYAALVRWCRRRDLNSYCLAANGV